MTDSTAAAGGSAYMALIRRFFPGLLLLGLLIAAGVLAQRTGVNGGGGPVGNGGGGAGDGTALERHGFSLTEVSKASGINFTHHGPTFDAKLAHIMPQVAAMGAAVSVVDVDGDGWQDLYVTDSAEGSANRLYRNKGDGSFEDIAAAVGLADVNVVGSGVSAGSSWADFDNDGDRDVFLYKWGKSELFESDGGKRFTPVGTAGLPAWGNINSATWLDYDRDGLLDLFFAGYYDEKIDLWQLADTKMMPESFEYADNGGRRYLYHNLGGGAFEDVTERVGIDSRRWALAVAAADLRGTGYPDIVVANDYGVSEYWANDGAGHFNDIGADKDGIGYRPKSGMNVAFGDIYNDGRRGIYISNISEEGVLMQGNNLWLPRKDSPADAPKFDNLASSLGIELGGWSFGAQFGDLNNDGHADLFLTNGFVSQNKDKSYWYDYSKVAGGNSAIISDAANWPAMDDTSLAGYQAKRVWLNDGAGQFTDVAQQVGVTDTFDGRAVALADLWHRGALDVIVAHQRGPLLVYKNEVVTQDRHWIAFDLTGAGAVNRDAIGAQVVVRWGAQEQLQEVLAASGFCAQNTRQLHFGLGADAAVESAVVRWPDGTETTLTAPAVDQVHTLTAGEPATQSR